MQKYNKKPAYQKGSNGGIDVKINGAFVLLGLLYGQGDMEKTAVITVSGNNKWENAERRTRNSERRSWAFGVHRLAFA